MDKEARTDTFTVTSLVCLIGCLFFLLLKKNNKIQEKNDDISNKMSPLTASKNCFAIFKKKKMIYLTIACFYTGLEQVSLD